MAWRRHLFYTRTSTRATWKLRLAVLAVVVLASAATRGVWTAQLGRSLVCEEDAAPSDLLLVENFDPDYLVFERAAALQAAGLAPRALVPVQASSDPGVPNPVSKGIAEVMARQARLHVWEVLPIRETEPITLNAAGQLRDHLVREHVQSLVLVTRAFRSRRSALAYRAVLDPAGIQVRCAPVFGLKKPETWIETWHGVQGVVEEQVKLQYYRFYVLPVLARGSHGARAVGSGSGGALQRERRDRNEAEPMSGMLGARNGARRGPFDGAIVGPDDPVLVTGATGFIGCRVVASLLDHGFRHVRAFVRPSSDLAGLEAIRRTHLSARVEVMRGNLLSAGDCDQAARDAAVIYHLAAGTGEKSFPEAFRHSVVTTRNLLDAALRHGGLRRFVNVSSFAVYTNRGKPRTAAARRVGRRSSETPERRGEAYCYAKVKQDELVARVRDEARHSLRPRPARGRVRTRRDGDHADGSARELRHLPPPGRFERDSLHLRRQLRRRDRAGRDCGQASTAKC